MVIHAYNDVLYRVFSNKIIFVKTRVSFCEILKWPMALVLRLHFCPLFNFPAYNPAYTMPAKNNQNI